MNLTKSPFNIYDLFSYLSNGFILLVAIYYLWFRASNAFENIVSQFTLSIVIVMIIIISYIIGHIISLFSSLFYEKIIIRKLLGYPSDNFFSKKHIRLKIARKVFGLYDYKKTYGSETQNKIEKKFKKAFNLIFEVSDNFNLCFHYVKEKSTITYNRLLTFISIYGFCRNLSFNLFLISIFLFISKHFIIGSVLIVASYLFFLRYLKFFRQYGDEVYKTFLVL